MGRSAKCKSCSCILLEDATRHKVSGGYLCDSCKKIAVEEKESFNILYDYILTKYFINSLPTVMIKEIRALRSRYTFSIILSCFQSIEKSLYKAYYQKTFSSDYNRARYLMGALGNNIDGFYRKHNEKEAESIETQKIDNTFKIIEKRNKTVEDKNYDILDW